jgi:hypothetical protein
MNTQHDPQLQEAYRRFDRNHANLRTDLLEKLQCDSPGMKPPPPIRLSGRWRGRRWHARLAASVLLAAALWAMFFRSPNPTFGITDAVDRLAACRSVRVEGWREIEGVRYPWHVYVEAGSRFWSTTLAVENGNVSTGYSTSDSKHYLAVSDVDHTAVFGDEDPLVFELTTTRLLQITLPGQLLGGKHGGFVKTGVSTLNGLRADVYERREPVGTREVVWLNPSNGIPIRSASFARGGDRREHQLAQLDVTTNVPRPLDMPPVNPPGGYLQIHRDREPREALGGTGVGINGERFQVLLALNLDGRAILLCWSHFDEADPGASELELGGPVGSPQSLEVTSPDANRKYLAFHLHDDPWDQARHARWSLLVPEDGGQVGPAQIKLARPGGAMGMGLSPLRFDQPDLRRLVVQAQQLTLPRGAPAIDLNELEKLVQKQRHSAR